MLISENLMRQLIQVLLMENMLKEDDAESANGDLYKIPKLRRGYWTLFELLKGQKKVGGENDAIKTVRDLIKRYDEKFLFKGDTIKLSDLSSTDGGNPVILSYKDGKTDVFKTRKTVAVTLKMIKDAIASGTKPNIGDIIHKGGETAQTTNDASDTADATPQTQQQPQEQTVTAAESTNGTGDQQEVDASDLEKMDPIVPKRIALKNAIKLSKGIIKSNMDQTDDSRKFFDLFNKILNYCLTPQMINQVIDTYNAKQTLYDFDAPDNDGNIENNSHLRFNQNKLYLYLHKDLKNAISSAIIKKIGEIKILRDTSKIKLALKELFAEIYKNPKRTEIFDEMKKGNTSVNYLYYDYGKIVIKKNNEKVQNAFLAIEMCSVIKTVVDNLQDLARSVDYNTYSGNTALVP